MYKIIDGEGNVYYVKADSEMEAYAKVRGDN